MRISARRAACLLMLAGSPVAAATTERPPARSAALIDALAACLGIADDAPRLACSDRAGRDLVAAARAGELVAVDRDEVRRTRTALFGFALPPATVLDRITDGDGKRGETAARLDAVIARATRDRHDKWTIELAEGATWQTTESSTGAEPRAGQKVTITRGAIGGYILKAEGGRAVRARRVG